MLVTAENAPPEPEPRRLIYVSRMAAAGMTETEVGARFFKAKQDPYVKLSLDGVTCQTSYLDGAGTDADWHDEVLALNVREVAARHQSLRVEVVTNADIYIYIYPSNYTCFPIRVMPASTNVCGIDLWDGKQGYALRERVWFLAFLDPDTKIQSRHTYLPHQVNVDCKSELLVD